MHARAAAKFVKLATSFQSSITLTKEELKADGKSIMSLLTLAAEKGSRVTLTTIGKDEDKAFAALKDLIENGFGEEI